MTEKGKLLVVDDEQFTLDLVTEVFEDTNIIAQTLTSGEHLHQTIETFQPDILLLDRMMPGKTGIELCREIRKYDMNTVIIFFSSLGEAEDQEQGYAAGAQDYLPKPFSMDVLERKVDEWMIKIQQHKALETRVAFLLMMTDRIDWAIECCQEVLEGADMPEKLRFRQEMAIKWLEGLRKMYTSMSQRKSPGSDYSPADIIREKTESE